MSNKEMVNRWHSGLGAEFDLGSARVGSTDARLLIFENCNGENPITKSFNFFFSFFFNTGDPFGLHMGALS